MILYFNVWYVTVEIILYTSSVANNMKYYLGAVYHHFIYKYTSTGSTVVHLKTIIHIIN